MTETEAASLKVRISTKVGLSAECDGLSLVWRIAERELPQGPAHAAESELFDLREAFAAMNLVPLAQVYLNWYRFDQIDQFAFDDLARFFDDICYPGPDDIDIFDETLTWLVSISHEGELGWVNLS